MLRDLIKREVKGNMVWEVLNQEKKMELQELHILWRETIILRKEHHISLRVIQSSETIKYLFRAFALYDPNTPFKHLDLTTSPQLPLAL